MDETGNILSGDLNSLKAYKDIVMAYDDACNQKSLTEAEEKRLEKDLALNRKNLRDNIESTVKKRRSEVADKFDNEIDKAQDKLKKIRGQRGKAKEKGVKERISDETADLRGQNKELKHNVKTALKNEKLPKFCGSGFYFTLYFTKGPGEIFLCALMIIIMFLLLPAAVYVALPLEKLSEGMKIPSFAITYFVVVLIVFFIYKIIGDQTKHKHNDGLRGIRLLRDQINGNRKQIRNIATAIKRDKNEDMYGLHDYDAKIQELESEINTITAEKNDALKNFDDNTRAEITAEIEGREMPRINDIEARYNDTVKQREEFEDAVKQTGLKLSTDYEAYIGKDFSDISRLDELIGIMETGRAATVSEAINVYRTKE